MTAMQAWMVAKIPVFREHPFLCHLNNVAVLQVWQFPGERPTRQQA